MNHNNVWILELIDNKHKFMWLYIPDPRNHMILHNMNGIKLMTA